MAEFPSEERHDFDLEVVLRALEACKLSDDTLLLDEYLQAYHELCRFFRLTGRLFGFVASDLESKIHVLEVHRKSDDGNNYHSIQSMVEFEVNNGTTGNKGHTPSGSRTLLRLHRAFEFILAFMERIQKSTAHDKTSQIASEVYAQTLANHHPWFTRQLAAIAMYMLPTRNHLIEVMCKHDNDKVLELLDPVLKAGKPVYNATQKLYEENELLFIP